MIRYIFITGGVVSSLGKGIASAALLDLDLVLVTIGGVKAIVEPIRDHVAGAKATCSEQQ